MNMGLRNVRSLVLILGLWLSGGVHSILASGADTDGRSGAEVVVVVSPDNPVKSLSRRQLEDLFLGRAAQFPDGRQAVPVDQSPDSPARRAFNTSLLERSPAQVRAHWAKIIFTGRGRPPVDVADDQAVKAAIESNPQAIGYIRPEAVDGRVVVVAVQ